MPARSPDFEVAIVGAGFSGLGMAIALQKAGRGPFVILEKAAQLGGTWRENRYPGCACDVPSHLYSYSFEPNPGWTRMFAPQPEILAYLERCAAKYGLLPHIRFDTEVVSARFDQAHALWRVRTRGSELTARHLVFGVGALSRPAFPQLPGLDKFEGTKFHTAEWNPDYTLDGKRISVIGTGASAVQLVPEVARRAAQLDLYQRTPPWVLAKPDRPISERERSLYARVPLAQQLYRSAIYWVMESMACGFIVDPRLMRVAAKAGRKHIAQQIQDPVLRQKVTPTYMPGCKRILLSDTYFPALAQPNVDVITDGIVEVKAHSLVTKDGRERPTDAIIFGTGFRVADMLTPMEVFGLDGVELNTAWKDRVEAYLGIAVSGFPNLYLLMGPNTGLGHSSMIFMIEAQIRFAVRCIEAIDKRGALFADVRSDAQREFNDGLQPRLQSAVWGSGCASWYLDQHGRNCALWPGFTFEYWLKTARPAEWNFEFAGQKALP